jgi:hypothetical protein
VGGFLGSIEGFSSSLFSSHVHSTDGARGALEIGQEGCLDSCARSWQRWLSSSCECDYDQTRQKGLITIKIDLKLAGRNDEYQSIHLNILPQTIVACSIIPSSFNNMLPHELMTKLRGVSKAKSATTLTLQLENSSVVLVPPGLTESISPANPSDGDFYAIS